MKIAVDAIGQADGIDWIDAKKLAIEFGERQIFEVAVPQRAT